MIGLFISLTIMLVRLSIQAMVWSVRLTIMMVVACIALASSLSRSRARRA